MRTRVGFLALSLSMIATASYAADVVKPLPPAPKPIVVTAPPANPFQGFYLGGNVGYGSANRYGCYDTFGGSIPPDCSVSDKDFDYGQHGWVVGGQAGINHVVGGQHGLVIGAEVSADLSGITGNLTDQFPGYDGTGDWNWLALGMAKIGVTHGNWLLYAQGGVALGGFTFNSTSCNFSSNNQGWAYGVGTSVATSSNNSLFVDWTHIDFTTKDASCGDTFATTVATKPKIDLVRFGFNHAFH